MRKEGIGAARIAEEEPWYEGTLSVPWNCQHGMHKWFQAVEPYSGKEFAHIPDHSFEQCCLWVSTSHAVCRHSAINRLLLGESSGIKHGSTSYSIGSPLWLVFIQVDRWQLPSGSAKSYPPNFHAPHSITGEGFIIAA